MWQVQNIWGHPKAHFTWRDGGDQEQVQNWGEQYIFKKVWFFLKWLYCLVHKMSTILNHCLIIPGLLLRDLHLYYCLIWGHPSIRIKTGLYFNKSFGCIPSFKFVWFLSFASIWIILISIKVIKYESHKIFQSLFQFY